MTELALVVKVARKRFAVVHWWGNCSYTRLKVTYEVRKQLCPFCGSELHDGDYSGSMYMEKNRHAVDYVRDSWSPLFENGVRVWRVLPKRKPHWLITEKVLASYD
jgi:hypothetical protein